MPNTREKLIELLKQGADNTPCDWDCWDKKCVDCIRETTADHLIANGVTVQKWIPVTERLPEKMGEHILVCYSDGWVCDQYTPADDGVTHWMPLPEAPKGE